MSEAIYIINLSKLYRTGRRRRAPRAVKHIRELIKRHTKAEKVVLDSSISKHVFERRYDKPPRRVAVAVMKLDPEGKVVKASLAVPVALPPQPEGSTQ